MVLLTHLHRSEHAEIILRAGGARQEGRWREGRVEQRMQEGVVCGTGRGGVAAVERANAKAEDAVIY